MPIKIFDRVLQKTSTAGTGSLTLGASQVPYLDFSDVYSNNETLFYCIQNENIFEVGIGTYSGNQLSRDTVLKSSNSDNLVNLAGNPDTDVFVDYPASGAVYTSGDRIVENINGIDFNLGASPGHKEGRIFYDQNNHSLAVYNDEAEITLQVGQEEYLRVRNNTSGTIFNGEAVRIFGAQGNSVTIEKAIATGDFVAQAIGLATHDIENNSFGYVTTYGTVRDLDTSDFNDGDEVFLSSVVSGGLTGVSPIAPNYKLSLGHVVRSHPSVGQIVVKPSTPKLGGPDIKSTNGNNIGVSGVTFVEILTSEGAAILASNTDFVYDSGNQILEINAGGIKFPDGNTQTIAFTGVGDVSATGLSDFITIDLNNQLSGSGSFKYAGDTASIDASLTAAAISGQSSTSSIADADNFIIERGAALRKVQRSIVVGGLATTGELIASSGYLQNQITSNDSDISALQTATGNLDTRVTQNAADIVTVSGIAQDAYDASGYLQGQIDTNDSDISALQTATGNLDTRVTQNTTDIVTVSGIAQDAYDASGYLQGQIDTNDSDISALQTATGNLDTRVTQNDSDIVSVSGLLYNYWVLRGDGVTTTNVDSTEQVQFKGAGSVSVDLGGTDNREVIISGIAPSGGGMTNWVLSVTGDNTTITQAEIVTFSGQGNVLTTRSGNYVIISGIDQDLSSYATTTYVDTVSGYLQGQIDTNDSDISALQTATGNLDTRVTQNAADIVTVSGIAQDAYDASGYLQGQIDTNDSDISALQTATGNLDTRVTQNAADITSVSGLLYNNWNISVTGASDNITSNETVTFTGAGNTTLTYEISSNILTISGTDQDLSSYATTSYVDNVSGYLQGQIDTNDSDISALQTATGNLDTRVTQNAADIVTVSGIAQDAYDASGYLQGQIDTNDSDISALQTATGNLDTRVTQNAADIVTVSGIAQDAYDASGYLQGQIDTNDSDISALQTATGNLDTRVTQNTSDITSVSGLLYNNWNVNVTGNIDSILSNETVIFTGVGLSNVSYNSSTNTVTISGQGGGGTMDNWNLSVTGDSTVIGDGETVDFTGQGNISLSRVSNTVVISGSDQDLSSYATTSYVDTVSGYLQGQIDTNDSDISALQTATGNLDTRVTQNSGDIVSVSGLLYNNWNISITGASDSITSNQTVTFTGAGNTSITYNVSSNIVTVSGSGGGGGGGTPGGSDTNVQFNNGGSFGGDANFTWDSTNSGLNISGSLTATTKSFLINHPTKDGKLQYGSLEGPENGVYVRGTTDQDTIYLPDYWIALVDENTITVNLTPVGVFQPLYVLEKNSLYIKVGGVDGMYDYIIYAERKDVEKLVVEF